MIHETIMQCSMLATVLGVVGSVTGRAPGLRKPAAAFPKRSFMET